MVDKKKLGGRYEFSFDVNSDTIALIYLSERYKLDLLSLLLLYEKFGRDVFYFFFLLSGRATTFPKASKLIRVLDFCSNVQKNILSNKPIELGNSEYKSVFDSVMSKLVTTPDNQKKFTHCIRVYNNESGEFNFKFNGKGRVPDENLTQDGEGDGLDYEYPDPEEPDTGSDGTFNESLQGDDDVLQRDSDDFE